MSERKNPDFRDENPVDIIMRTIGTNVVVIRSYVEDSAIKFHAQITGGPSVILQNSYGEWVGTHPDQELVDQLGFIIECATA